MQKRRDKYPLKFSVRLQLTKFPIPPFILTQQLSPLIWYLRLPDSQEKPRTLEFSQDNPDYCPENGIDPRPNWFKLVSRVRAGQKEAISGNEIDQASPMQLVDAVKKCSKN